MTARTEERVMGAILVCVLSIAIGMLMGIWFAGSWARSSTKWQKRAEAAEQEVKILNKAFDRIHGRLEKAK